MSLQKPSYKELEEKIVYLEKQLDKNIIANRLALLEDSVECVYWISTQNFEKYEYISPSIKKVCEIDINKLMANPLLKFDSIFEEDKTEYLKLITNNTFPYTIEYRIKTPEGKIKWIREKAHLTKSKASAPLIAGTCMDISAQKSIEYELIEKNEEYKQTNEELLEAKNKAQESDRLKSAFITNMSHEIRTPMNGIIGFAHLLENSSLSEEKKQEYTKLIINNSYQLLQVVTDILDISTIETGQTQIIKTSTVINDIIRKKLEYFDPIAAKKNLQLYPKISLTDEQSTIICDSDKIEQILNNLISNAIKFTHFGHILFGYTLEDKNLHFFVKALF